MNGVATMLVGLAVAASIWALADAFRAVCRELARIAEALTEPAPFPRPAALPVVVEPREPREPRDVFAPELFAPDMRAALPPEDAAEAATAGQTPSRKAADHAA